MLYRKIEKVIFDYLKADTDKVMVVTGARQIGKSYIIRYCASKCFENVVEINLIEDSEGNRLFESVRTIDEFYLALAAYTSKPLGNSSDTLIFLDEIQEYPHLLTMLKFLREDGRYRYIASGSLLGVTLKRSASVPLGSIDNVEMFPLDFEEFLYANDFGREAIDFLRQSFFDMSPIPESLHSKVMDIFKRYLLVGGLPEAVNVYLESRDLNKVRTVQNSISQLYKIDAAKYDKAHSLKIGRIYEMIPSNMENLKKRVVYKDIDDTSRNRSSDYEEEIEYLIGSGIALRVTAISNPRFPLTETQHKNLLKLYLNDPGLLTAALYRNNPAPVLNNECSVNLGSVYECAVACQLAANDNRLFYYDNRNRGEVDFLFDDFKALTVVPIEVKSGKDYQRHIAISRMVSTEEYHIPHGYVLSNYGEIQKRGGIYYIPVYYSMFFDNRINASEPVII